MNKPSTPNTKPFPRRKRLRLPEFDYSQPGYAYFLTLGVKSSRPLFRHNKFAAQVISILLEERSRHRVKIFAYCLMPDHLHVVLSSREGGKDIPSLIRNFKRLTTRVSWNFAHEGPLWQRSFYDPVVRRDEDLKSVCQYVLENPVRAGTESPSATSATTTPPPRSQAGTLNRRGDLV